MATYLITGGLGFIGSHLADALVARGDNIRILDDLSTGRRSNAPEQAEIIIGDVADRKTTAEALAGTDGCFHLAAIASVEKGNEEWLGTHHTNLGGTVAVLEAARKARKARNGEPVPVVFASSAAIYGDNPHVPLAENAAARPLSAYGVDKLGSELHARIALTVHDLPTTCLRFFNVYGPRQDPRSPYSGVIAIFAERLLKGEPVKIFGDGEQTRDFTYVSDVVRFLLAAADRRPIRRQIFNVCTGRATSVRQLAMTIAGICAVKPVLNFSRPRLGDIRRSCGDPSRAMMTLGIKAETCLTEGLERTLHWIGNGAP
ncbi:MAG: NAD-dependent epimerase/dehydratase family protein [Sphingomonadales bacterium]